MVFFPQPMKGPASHGTKRLIGSLSAGCAFVLAYISRLQGKCVGGVPCPIGRTREKAPREHGDSPRAMVRLRHYVWEGRTQVDVNRRSPRVAGALLKSLMAGDIPIYQATKFELLII